MSLPELLTEIEPTREWVRSRQRAGGSVGVVPTMGALHEGHLSLARAACGDCDAVLATIFVNPTQFAAGEDFETYPRDLARDRRLLDEAGVDAVFAPTAELMYPSGFGTEIDVGDAAVPLEGEFRPTHFRGVATVVAKLLSIAPADRAYFGRKDYQQTVVIRRMVEDLNLPVEVVVCPIVREADGLAMSSRNAYLDSGQRTSALALHRGLSEAQRRFEDGERNAGALRAAIEDVVGQTEGVELEYAAVVRDGGVDQPEVLEGPSVALVAARVGKTRLIDNVRLA